MVRHGRTAWNREEIFRGMSDVPLDDVGREQARLLKEALSCCANIRSIVASPLSRAFETASIIATGPVTVTADGRFADIDAGSWEGQTLAEITVRYPEEFSVWVNSPERFCFPGGESLSEVQERAWRGVLSLVPVLREHDVVVVSHRLVLKTVILRTIGAGLENFWRIRIDTASISVMELDPLRDEPFFVVTRLNDTSHLKPLDWKDPRDF